jgi:hypothetical protein
MDAGELLRSLIEAFRPHRYIATKLKRIPAGVKGRARKLGLKAKGK